MKNVLYIFDFDDTLALSDARVHVAHHDGTSTSLKSNEFAKYVAKKGDSFNFDEFEIYPPNGRLISSTFDSLIDAISSEGVENVIILTARSADQPVRKFLSDHGISNMPKIYAVGSSNPNAKGSLVKNIAKQKNFNHIHVFEDNFKNIRSIKTAVKSLGIPVSHTLVKHHVNEKSQNALSMLKEFVGLTLLSPHKKPAAGFILVKLFPDGLRVLGLKIDGFFDLPKGKKELGESSIETALRECEEESGISSVAFPWGMNPIQANHVTLFIAITEQEPLIRANPSSGRLEHESASWLTWDEMIEQCKPYLRPAIESAKMIIENIE